MSAAGDYTSSTALLAEYQLYPSYMSIEPAVEDLKEISREEIRDESVKTTIINLKLISRERSQPPEPFKFTACRVATIGVGFLFGLFPGVGIMGHFLHKRSVIQKQREAYTKAVAPKITQAQSLRNSFKKEIYFPNGEPKRDIDHIQHLVEEKYQSLLRSSGTPIIVRLKRINNELGFPFTIQADNKGVTIFLPIVKTPNGKVCVSGFKQKRLVYHIPRGTSAPPRMMYELRPITANKRDRLADRRNIYQVSTHKSQKVDKNLQDGIKGMRKATDVYSSLSGSAGTQSESFIAEDGIRIIRKRIGATLINESRLVEIAPDGSEFFKQLATHQIEEDPYKNLAIGLKVLIDFLQGSLELIRVNRIHRDIKLSNTIIEGNSQTGFRGKLIDIGDSVTLEDISSGKSGVLFSPGHSPSISLLIDETLHNCLIFSQNSTQTEIYSIACLIKKCIPYLERTVDNDSKITKQLHALRNKAKFIMDTIMLSLLNDDSLTWLKEGPLSDYKDDASVMRQINRKKERLQMIIDEATDKGEKIRAEINLKEEINLFIKEIRTILNPYQRHLPR